MLLRTAIRRTAVLALAFSATVSCTSSDPLEVTTPSPPPAGEYAILFVGNSLTFFNNLPIMVERLLETSAIGPTFVSMAAFPNYGLQDHWIDGRARAAIAAGGWEVVVMQQGPSATEGRPSLLEYSERFAPEIRAGGGEPALYGVWPARVREFDFPGVSESYSMAAERVNGLFFPAGDAWLRAWEANPDLQLYGPDQFHPSTLGSYLAALVMYEVLSGESARDLPASTPIELGILQGDTTLIRTVHEAASATVEALPPR